MVSVLVPTHLRNYTRGASVVSAQGRTLAEVFRDLDQQFPGIAFRVIDEQGHVRTHMVVFVDGERLDDLQAALGEAREVQIIGALSGG